MLSKVVTGSRRWPLGVNGALSGVLLLVVCADAAVAQSILLQKALAQSEKNLRMVMGTPVPLAARPWQVGLIAAAKSSDLEGLFCGGVLLTPNWVLTAAHCVDNNTKPSQVQVLFGSNSLSGTGDRMDLAEIVPFGGYEATAQGVPVTGDAALLRLRGAIRSMATATLATAQDFEQAKEVTVSGWGRIQFDGAKSQELLQVVLEVVPNKECNAALSWDGAVRDDMFCAEGTGQSACLGDSGGPVTIEKPNGDVVLAGLVSWGHPKCDVPDKFNVFQRVAAVTEFIQKTTGHSFSE